MAEAEPGRIESEHYAVQRPTLGAPPGSGVDRDVGDSPVLRVCAYGPERVEMGEATTFAEAMAFETKLPFRWIAVEGGTSSVLLREAAERFTLPLLVLEDIATQRSWPKVEFLDEHAFIVARRLRYDDDMNTEQLNIIVGKTYVISFHRDDSSALDSLRTRIQNPKGWLRRLGPDYLAYAILDITADAYFVALEAMGIHLDELESQVFENVNQPQSESLHRARHDLLLARRAVRPMREMVHQLLRSPDSPMTEEAKPFLRDCYDHVIEALDLVETYRELVSSLVEIYMTAASHRTNEIMRVLTLISSIFIPLGFLAGLYGMNFDQSSPYNMPELRLPWGYPLILTVMASIAVGLLVFFFRKGWIGGQRDL